MIYSGNSLRKRFVSGRYTLIFLLGGATLLWLAGTLTGLSAAVVRPILLANYAWMDSVVSLLLFAGAALVLNSFVIIEGRNSWLGGLVVWLAGLFCNVQEVSVSLSTLLLMLLLTVLFNCYPRDGVQRWLYAAFALLGFCSLLQPQLLYLIPLFFVYIYPTPVFPFYKPGNSRNGGAEGPDGFPKKEYQCSCRGAGIGIPRSRAAHSWAALFSSQIRSR